MIKNIMRYSVKPRDQIIFKGFGFPFFVKNMVKSLISMNKSLLAAQKSTTDALDHKNCLKQCPQGLKQINGAHKNRRNINTTNRNTETEIHTTKKAITNY